MAELWLPLLPRCQSFQRTDSQFAVRRTPCCGESRGRAVESQKRATVAGGEPSFLEQREDLRFELEQAEGVGNGRSVLARAGGGLLLGQTEGGDQSLEGAGLFDGIQILPLQIFNYAISPYEDWHRQAWAGALVLLFFVALINIGVRVLTRERIAQRP